MQLATKVPFTAEPDDRGFVAFAAPLPVGSSVFLVREGRAPRAARVEGVIEKDGGDEVVPGMCVRFTEPEKKVRAGRRRPTANGPASAR